MLIHIACLIIFSFAATLFVPHESKAQVLKEKLYALAYNNGNAWCVLEKPESSAMFFDFHYNPDSVELIEYKGGDYFKVRSLRDKGRVGYILINYLLHDSTVEAQIYIQNPNLKYRSSTNSSISSPSSGNYSTNETIHTGPRGGKYYINKNGNKTYIKKK